MSPVSPFAESGDLGIIFNGFSKTATAGEVEFSIREKFISATEAEGAFQIGEPVNFNFQWQ
jgi:hypothetical protein